MPNTNRLINSDFSLLAGTASTSSFTSFTGTPTQVLDAWYFAEYGNGGGLTVPIITVSQQAMPITQAYNNPSGETSNILEINVTNLETTTATMTGGATTSGSMSVTVTSNTNAAAGQLITGTGIPPGTFVAYVNGDGVTILMTQAATATGSTLTFTVSTYIKLYQTLQPRKLQGKHCILSFWANANIAGWNLVAQTRRSYGTLATGTLAGGASTNLSTAITVTSTLTAEVGDTITGTDLPAATTFTIASTTLTLSQAANATVAAGLCTYSSTLTAAATTLGSTTVTCASNANTVAGQYITGAGILAGTFIAYVTSSTSLVISQPASATGTGLTLGFGGTVTVATTASSTTATVTSATGLASGMTITGPGIVSAATITSINSLTSLTISAAATGTTTSQTYTLTRTISPDVVFTQQAIPISGTVGKWQRYAVEFPISLMNDTIHAQDISGFNNDALIFISLFFQASSGQFVTQPNLNASLPSAAGSILLAQPQLEEKESNSPVRYADDVDVSVINALYTAVNAVQNQVNASIVAFGIGAEIMAKSTTGYPQGTAVAGSVLTPQQWEPAGTTFTGSGDIISNVCSSSNTTWTAMQTITSNYVGLFKRLT